jgi:hypothetical protein
MPSTDGRRLELEKPYAGAQQRATAFRIARMHRSDVRRGERVREHANAHAARSEVDERGSAALAGDEVR